MDNKEKFMKTLDICIDLNSNVAESSACLARAEKTTCEGFSAATNLIEIAMKTKDINLFTEVFNKTRKLIPDASKIDKELYRELIKQRNVFDRLVVKLVSQHPSFMIKVIIPSISRGK